MKYFKKNFSKTKKYVLQNESCFSEIEFTFYSNRQNNLETFPNTLENDKHFL